MGIRAVFIKFTFSFLLPEFAELSLVVVVLNIHHFENKFRGKGIHSLSFVLHAMGEMAADAFCTVTCLLEMLTYLSLVSIG
jgi:hypothetical protein